jgi:class 3 adenylate cyclase
MANDPLHFEWKLQLQSSAEQFWPYIADTDSLNRDIGFSAITRLDEGEIVNSRKRAQQMVRGFLVQEWVEEPFQWVRPFNYTAHRNYVRGLFVDIHQQVDLTPNDDGTDIHYQIWVWPRYGLLRGAIQSSFANLDFTGLFQRYDQQIQAADSLQSALPFVGGIDPVEFVEGGQARLSQLRDNLIRSGASETIAGKLADYLSHADDLDAMAIQPYALADHWNQSRREVLDTCLTATRLGLLDMSWDLLCPLCRGAKATVDHLHDITQTVHCEVCHIDYEANFEQSVELTFRPSALIREIAEREYCVGGPEVTPHIVIQQLLAPGQQRTVSTKLISGRYRVRTMSLKGGQFLRVYPTGAPSVALRATTSDGWPGNEPVIAPGAEITLENSTDDEQLFVVEHLSWSDQSVTAADVTTRQVYRDLFSSEALRPREQISISNLTFVFTDLRGSTRMYIDVGDAPAFGLVMDHFDILRRAIREGDGAIVKTIGDAVMAVFRQPEKAVEAMARAHRELAASEALANDIKLRVGIHSGRCIAVTLNEKLDYFGTTINTTARLEGQSDGTDLVISDVVYNDPKVQALLEDPDNGFRVESFTSQLKGFDEDFTLYRVFP